MKLDEIDFKILEMLKRDARTPFTEVGRDLGISDATVHVRVNKMMDEGIIKRYTTVVDEEASDGLYSEEDNPNPLNQYGRSKLMGENFVKDLQTQQYADITLLVKELQPGTN